MSESWPLSYRGAALLPLEVVLKPGVVPARIRRSLHGKRLDASDFSGTDLEVPIEYDIAITHVAFALSPITRYKIALSTANYKILVINRSHAQLILHELGDYLGYSPPPPLDRLIEDAQKIYQQRPVLQETLATATQPRCES